MNNCDQNAANAGLHLYEDDKTVFSIVFYMSYTSGERSAKYLLVIQNRLHQLKLVLNAGKTKLRSQTWPPIPVSTPLDGEESDAVHWYKCLGIVKKLRIKLGFYFRN